MKNVDMIKLNDEQRSYLDELLALDDLIGSWDGTDNRNIVGTILSEGKYHVSQRAFLNDLKKYYY